MIVEKCKRAKGVFAARLKMVAWNFSAIFGLYLQIAELCKNEYISNELPCFENFKSILLSWI
jgi:hypothetical protein